MGFALSAEGRATMRDCARAGVVFRPGGGRLNPVLTRGEPPAGLLERVRAHRAELLAFWAAVDRYCEEMDSRG